MIKKDTNLTINNGMFLEISEVRSSSTTHSPKEGYSEVTKKTETRFNWKLRGMSALLDHTSDDFDPKKQEIYDVTINSHGFNFHHGFKTREKAIQNALEFAKRNGIEVDGYRPK